MSDTFRTKYRELTQEELDQIDSIKTKAGVLLDDIVFTHQQEIAKDPRMVALAKTKLEECVMWMTKSITS